MLTSSGRQVLATVEHLTRRRDPLVRRHQTGAPTWPCPLEIKAIVPVEDMSELGRPVANSELLSGPAAGDPEVAALDELVGTGRVRRLAVERFDEQLAPVLRDAGFVPSPRGLVRCG